MDIKKTIREGLEKNLVVMGTKESMKALKDGKVSMITYSTNCPKQTKEEIQRYAKLSKSECIDFSGNSSELGTFCGKAFRISVLAVLQGKK
jgi:large subunit ribosomal protein L30e